MHIKSRHDFAVSDRTRIIKSQVGAPISDSNSVNVYQSIDITLLQVNPITRTITQSEGLILAINYRET